MRASGRACRRQPATPLQDLQELHGESKLLEPGRKGPVLPRNGSASGGEARLSKRPTRRKGRWYGPRDRSGAVCKLTDSGFRSTSFFVRKLKTRWMAWWAFALVLSVSSLALPFDVWHRADPVSCGTCPADSCSEFGSETKNSCSSSGSCAHCMVTAKFSVTVGFQVEPRHVTSFFIHFVDRDPGKGYPPGIEHPPQLS